MLAQLWTCWGCSISRINVLYMFLINLPFRAAVSYFINDGRHQWMCKLILAKLKIVCEPHNSITDAAPVDSCRSDRWKLSGLSRGAVSKVRQVIFPKWEIAYTSSAKGMTGLFIEARKGLHKFRAPSLPAHCAKWYSYTTLAYTWIWAYVNFS